MNKVLNDEIEEILPLERFNEWVHCICIVTFDLELGQTIEMIYPGSSRLSPSEKLQICYLSFPDSNNNCSRDSSYHFRVKCSSLTFNSFKCESRAKFESLAPIPMRPKVDYLFGFVHFRQERDATLPRGYFQKSVVLLSSLPLFEVYTHVVSCIAHSFFDSGEEVIERACQNIDRWPSPMPGETLTLPLLNTTLRCRIPSQNDILQHQIFFESRRLSFSSRNEVLLIPDLSPVMQETYFYNSTKDLLPHIQHLWELVLLGEPILAMAQTPAQCSQLVQSLTSLIWPLSYSNDYRPYFTIHDADFNEIASKQNPPNIIIGVTNPFFVKTLKHWPHILRITEAKFTEDTSSSSKALIKKVANGKKIESKPGFYTQYKPFLNSDKTLLKKLLKLGQRPDTVQNAILRKHFLDLTQNFMFPLERHISSLMPLQNQINPFKPLPQIRPFLMSEFLSTLGRETPSSKTGLKGDLRGLYKMFISKSPNFEDWWSRRSKEMDERLKFTHSEMLSTAVLNSQSLAGCSQVEIVDIVLRLKDRLDGTGIEGRCKIRLQLKNILHSIDDELKSIFMSSEALREVFNLV